MVKSVGIDPGEFEAKLVELDGSYRKARLSFLALKPVAWDAEGDAHAASLEAVKDASFPHQNMTLGFPCRETVLRTLSVPFKGKDELRKVIKFEAEGAIHSHSVDEMVVDFHVIEEEDDGTRVLAAAVPKAPLRAMLQALEASGIDPEVVDLDTMGLYRAAHWCGAFEPLEGGAAGDASDHEEQAGADEAASGDELVPRSAPTRLVFDIGARSTRILVVTDGRLRDMRALRSGVLSIAEEIAESTGASPRDAHAAMLESLVSGEDYVPVDESEAADVAADDDRGREGEDRTEGAAEKLPDAARTPIPHDVVAAARDRFLARLRREVVRFLTAIPDMDDLEVAWLCGGGSMIPGVAEMLEQALECPTRRLDVLAKLSHDLDPDEAARVSPRIVTAVGLALGRLGGPAGLDFRREDLAYTKGFDRIKFPLALTAMFALFFVVIWDIVSWRELKTMEKVYGATYMPASKSSEGSRQRGRSARTSARFYGYLGNVMVDGFFAGSTYFDRAARDALVKKLLQTPVFERLPVVRSELSKYFARKQSYYPEMRIGSGYGVLVEAANVLRQVEPQLGRYLLGEIEVRLPAGDRGRWLRFQTVLRTDDGSSFREKADVIRRAFQDAARSPDSAFLNLAEKDITLKGSFSGEGDEGAIFEFKVDLKPERGFPVYPPKQKSA